MIKISFEKLYKNTYEDTDIYIEVEDRCRDKTYLQKVKESYLANGENFIKQMEHVYEVHIYDKKNDTLFLISDMVGLNAIYYCQQNSCLFYNNDIMQLMEKHNIPKEINTDALPIYFNYHYFNSPETVFKNVFKLKHGQYIVFRNGVLTIKTYWNVIEEFNKNKNSRIKSFDECKTDLNNELNNYIRKVIETHNNLGVYLSGGIDSSLVTALSMKYLNKPINTFSIGFHEEEFNEAEKAKRIANYLGTNHHELYIDKQKAIDTIKKIIQYHSQPFADPSALASIVLNEYARENNIKDVLTGDGADQLFCGSVIYDTIYKVQKAHKLFNPLNIFINPKMFNFKKKLFFIYSNADKQYQNQCDVLYNENLLNGLFNKGNGILKSSPDIKSNNWQEKRMIFDFDTFCCELVLTKMGVASRKNNITIYSPFLSKKIIELSLRIPHKYKYYKKIKKYILKNILYDYVPKELLETNKKGFAIPTQKWLNTYLNEDLKRLSTKSFIEKQQLFNYDIVCKLLQNINNKEYVHIIWDYYIFQVWYETYMLKN